MLIPCDTKYAEVRVVESGELPFLTTTGWRLIAAVIEDSIERYSENTPHPAPQWNGQIVSTERIHVVKRTRYLVGRDTESTLGAMAADRDLALRGLQDANTEAKAAQTELQRVQREAKDVGAALAAACEQRSKSESFLVKMTEQRRKMEADLGKLRAAIGDLRFNEILETK